MCQATKAWWISKPAVQGNKLDIAFLASAYRPRQGDIQHLFAEYVLHVMSNKFTCPTGPKVTISKTLARHFYAATTEIPCCLYLKDLTSQVPYLQLALHNALLALQFGVFSATASVYNLNYLVFSQIEAKMHF